MSSEYESHLILQHLDDPLRILKWTLDEALFVLCAPYVGIMMNAPWVGVSFGILGSVMLKKSKQMFGEGTLIHGMYWYLPTASSRTLAPSYAREYVG